MHQNQLFSSLSHFVGFLLSVAGLILLIVFAVLYGRIGHIVGFTIFGVGLMLLYLASALYHILPQTHGAKSTFQMIDHSMIYVLIASTYTPLVLVLPQRAWGWSLFGIVWGLAGIGIVFEILLKKWESRWFHHMLYLVMGWLIIIALPLLLEALPPGGFGWLLFGGVLYTVGIIFFGLERWYPRRGWFGMHEAFHLFVMGGSFAHFWFMLQYVLYI